MGLSHGRHRGWLRERQIAPCPARRDVFTTRRISGQEPAAQRDRQGSRLSDCSGVPSQFRRLINLPDTFVN